MKLTKEQQDKINNLHPGQTIEIGNTTYWISMYGELHKREMKE